MKFKFSEVDDYLEKILILNNKVEYLCIFANSHVFKYIHISPFQQYFQQCVIKCMLLQLVNINPQPFLLVPSS